MTSSVNAVSSTSAAALQDQYMKLLVTQLSHQDPLDPMDNAQMTSQMVGLAQLEQSEKLNSNFSSMLRSQQVSNAGYLIGRTVTGMPTGDDAEAITGVVTEARLVDGKVQAVVKGQTIPLENITAVSDGSAEVSQVYQEVLAGLTPTEQTALQSVLSEAGIADKPALLDSLFQVVGTPGKNPSLADFYTWLDQIQQLTTVN